MADPAAEAVPAEHLRRGGGAQALPRYPDDRRQVAPRRSGAVILCHQECAALAWLLMFRSAQLLQSLAHCCVQLFQLSVTDCMALRIIRLVCARISARSARRYTSTACYLAAHNPVLSALATSAGRSGAGPALLRDVRLRRHARRRPHPLAHRGALAMLFEIISCFSKLSMPCCLATGCHWAQRPRTCVC